MSTIIDLDLYGRENQDGSAVEHLDDYAIGMALLGWITSKRGDILKYPEMGGVIDVALFKNMTESKIDSLIFTIKTEIYLVFSELLTLEEINVTNNYEQRYLQIDITYESLLSKQIRTTTLYVDSRIQAEKFTYEDVEYVGENLENFVILNLPTMQGKVLKYNIEQGSWVWGSFKLINLTHLDTHFTRILALVNG